MNITLNRVSTDYKYEFDIVDDEYFFSGYGIKSNIDFTICAEFGYLLLDDNGNIIEKFNSFGTFTYSFDENGVRFDINSTDTEDIASIYNKIFNIVENIKSNINSSLESQTTSNPVPENDETPEVVEPNE